MASQTFPGNTKPSTNYWLLISCLQLGASPIRGSLVCSQTPQEGWGTEKERQLLLCSNTPARVWSFQGWVEGRGDKEKVQSLITSCAVTWVQDLLGVEREPDEWVVKARPLLAALQGDLLCCKTFLPPLRL